MQGTAVIVAQLALMLQLVDAGSLIPLEQYNQQSANTYSSSPIANSYSANYGHGYYGGGHTIHTGGYYPGHSHTHHVQTYTPTTQYLPAYTSPIVVSQQTVPKTYSAEHRIVPAQSPYLARQTATPTRVLQPPQLDQSRRYTYPSISRQVKPKKQAFKSFLLFICIFCI